MASSPGLTSITSLRCVRWFPAPAMKASDFFIGDGTNRTALELRQNFTAVMRSWGASLAFESLDVTVTSPVADSTALRGAERIYMRLKRVGTDVTFYVSANGILWSQLLTATLPVSGIRPHGRDGSGCVRRHRHDGILGLC